jgi:hypothetical protein
MNADITTRDQLLNLKHHYTDPANQKPGWDKKMTDEFMRIVVGHFETSFGVTATAPLSLTFLSLVPQIMLPVPDYAED